VAGERSGGSGRLNAQYAIRAGEPRDIAWVIDLGRRTLDDSVSPLRETSAANVAASFDRLIEYALAQSHVLLVAEDALEPLGYVLFLDALPDEVTGSAQAFIVYFAVEPEARRRGVGRRLFLAAEDAARAKGLPYLTFMVTEENLAARELYAQLGYVTERRQLCKRL
jgi:ribosomal protein S18 acetylase RimI-like enzyme